MVKNTNQNSLAPQGRQRLNPGLLRLLAGVGVAGSRGLRGEGASQKADSGTRTVKCQTHMGKDKWHRLPRWPAR